MKKIDLVEIASRESDVKNVEDRLQERSANTSPHIWPEAMIAQGSGSPIFAKLEIASED